MAILIECPACHTKQARRNRKCNCGENLLAAKRANRLRYWIRWQIPGTTQRPTAFVGTSLDDALAADAKRKVQKKENRIFDMTPAANQTFRELADWYLDLVRVRALSSWYVKKIHLNTFCKTFGAVRVMDLLVTDLEEYQAKRLAAGKSASYIDQEIGDARAVVRKAFEARKISGDALYPFQALNRLLTRHSNARDRILSPAEFEALQHHAAAYLRPVIAMGYFTGMRRDEILSLTWDRLDLKGRLITLEPRHTKDDEPRRIVIGDALLEYLGEIPRALHTARVFLYKGRPISDIRGGLANACKKAGIPYGRNVQNGFIFHDLRHTFTTNARKAGVSETVIMKITGHATREMFDRYNTVDIDDAVEANARLESFLEKQAATKKENQK
jgi:integrase